MSVMRPLLAKCVNSDCDIQTTETLCLRGCATACPILPFCFGFQTPVRNHQTCMRMFCLGFFTLVCAHMCFVAREAAMWELEERHLQEKHQLLKQQLKDQYFMQRHQLLKRHEKVQAQSGIVNVTVKFE